MKRTNTSIDEISGKNLDRRVARRLLPYLRPHLAGILLSGFMVFVSAGVSLYSPRLLGHIVDKALLPRNLGLLHRFVALYAGLEVFRIICVFGQSLLLQRIGQKVMRSLRKDLFARLLRMPVPFFDRNPVGKLVTRVTNDTVNLSELFSAGFVMLLSDLILIFGVIAAVVGMHAQLGLLAVSVFPVMVIAMLYFSDRLRNSFRLSRDVLARLNAFFAERMQGMPVVQLMEREAFEKEQYRALSREYRERQFDGIHIYSLFHPSITVLSAASIAFVLWYGPIYLGRHEIALGTFVSFLAYVQLLYQPVRNITDRYNIFLAAMASAERIFTLLDMEEESGLGADGRRGLSQGGNRSLGTLKFENVSFTYPNTLDGTGTPSPALRDVSFSVGENETIAIVGHTGAGKTTITNLLFRFYEPTQGRILLGGTPIASIAKKELRERIGFVQQEVFLFSGSVRENLILLRRDLTDAEILDGCRRTGFDRVLQRLPHGLDSLLQERGANLSLGERQILAFTRVYLQQPDLLVLDEATSSVDHESERQLQNATRELVRGRAAIVIAHRLETVRNADCILVFERGQLVESGDHDSLVAGAGRYAKFVQLQEARSR
jgi:ATP-binding cassette, subfamily B, multidrug efflux pump